MSTPTPKSTPTPPSAAAVSMGSGIGSAQKTVAQGFSKFRNNKLVSGAANFLYSNSLVAKVVFLILVVIIFVFVLRIGTQIASWLFTPSKTPYLVPGLKSARKQKTISQDPRDRDSIPLERSKNQRDGITFTYSVWMMINSMDLNSGVKKHVFHKGSSVFKRSGDLDQFTYSDANAVPYPNICPGLMIDETDNRLHIYVNTYDKIVETISVPNIPIGKWFNVIIRLKNLNLDVFINGNVAVRHRLMSPVKQNYEDIHVNKNGGYDGFLSSLRYWNYALSSPEIMDVNRSGPSLKAENQQAGFPPYLSLRWYFGNSNNAVESS